MNDPPIESGGASLTSLKCIWDSDKIFKLFDKKGDQPGSVGSVFRPLQDTMLQSSCSMFAVRRGRTSGHAQGQ